MIELKTYEIFRNNLSSLKDTSYDRTDKEKPYMTNCEYMVVNFDDVKKEYIKDLGLGNGPSSNDALFENGQGELVFVEFKNGSIDSKNHHELGKKIYDSTLIFTDIISKGISYMRDNVIYILVYNQEKYKNNLVDKNLKNKNKKIEVQEADSEVDLSKSIAKLAKEEYIRFDLGKFKNYCFKEVHTYNEAEFEKYLSDLCLA